MLEPGGAWPWGAGQRCFCFLLAGLCSGLYLLSIRRVTLEDGTHLSPPPHPLPTPPPPGASGAPHFAGEAPVHAGGNLQSLRHPSCMPGVTLEYFCCTPHPPCPDGPCMSCINTPSSPMGGEQKPCRALSRAGVAMRRICGVSYEYPLSSPSLRASGSSGCAGRGTDPKYPLCV